MDLSSPLAALIPTLDAAVLDVLARTESALSATQVTRLAPRGGRTGLTLALDRLTTQGLVSAERANTGFLYRFNRQHVLAPVIQGALEAPLTIVAMLRGHVEQLPGLKHASLFGSFARGEAGPDSDIDLILITADSGGQADEEFRRAVRTLETDVLAWTGNRLEALVMTGDEFQHAVRSGEPLMDSLSAEALTLRGRDLSFTIDQIRDAGKVTP